MATHRIFLQYPQETPKRLGMHSFYIYNDGVLSIYNRGSLVYSGKVNQGEACIVKFQNGNVKVAGLLPPYKKGDFVSWLLGFNKNNRGCTQEEYEAVLEKERFRLHWNEYIEWETVGEHYVFMRCNDPIVKSRNVACFFSDDITKEEVLELIPLMTYYPPWYVSKVLQERFGVTEEEFEKAVKK